MFGHVHGRGPEEPVRLDQHCRLALFASDSEALLTEGPGTEPIATPRPRGPKPEEDLKHLPRIALQLTQVAGAHKRREKLVAAIAFGDPESDSPSCEELISCWRTSVESNIALRSSKRRARWLSASALAERATACSPALSQ